MKRSALTTLVLAACLLWAGSALSDNVSWQDRYAEAVQCYEQGNCPNSIEKATLVYKAAEQQFGAYSSNALKSLTLLTDIQRESGHWMKAALLVRKLRHVKEKMFGEDHPETVASLIGLADLSVLMGPIQEGESLYKKAMALAEGAGRKNDLWIAPAFFGLAAAYSAQRRYDEAEDLYKQALEIYEHHTKYQKDLVPRVAQTLENLGDLNRAQGRHESAVAYYDKAIQQYVFAGSVGKSSLPSVLARQGETSAEWGKPVRARHCFQRALGIHEKALGIKNFSAAAMMKRMADLYRDSGNPDQAERLYTKCRSVLEMCSPQDCPLLAATRKTLADVHQWHELGSAASPLYQRLLLVTSPQAVNE